MADAPRKRRWPLILAAFAVLLAFAGWWVDRQLEPTRLTATVLARAGAALGLEFTIDGTPEYALRPEPRLVLPKLTVRQPGAAAPLLTAVRAEISLPWDTITGGDSLVITRIELEKPQVDLDALLEWQSTQPPSNGETPSLTRGVSIRDGRVSYGNWLIDRLDMDLDRFERSEPLTLKLAASAVTEGFEIEFDSTMSIDRLAYSTSGKIAADGTTSFGGETASFSLESQNCGYHRVPLDVVPPQEVINCQELTFKGESPLPTFEAAIVSLGRGRLGLEAEISANGWMRDWPTDWPALPAPLAGTPTQFELRYAAPPDSAASILAKLSWGETKADVSFVMDDVLAWLDSGNSAPLPPLLGTVSTPSLEISGATLEGVTVQIEEDAPADADAEAQPKP